jgi:hypothetical protein
MPKRTRLHQSNKLDFYLSKANATNNGKDDCLSSRLRSLSDVVGDHGLQIHNVPYDGDCFLHAVLHQLSCLEQQQVTKTVLSLRRGAVLCLKSNPAIIVDDYFDRRVYKDCNDYLTRQSLPGEWLDEIMIRSVCNFVHTTQLYSNNSRKLFCDSGIALAIVELPWHSLTVIVLAKWCMILRRTAVM